MIDNRFSLTQHTEHKHLYHLRFSVVLPPNRYYVSQVDFIIAECKKQFPELIFDCQYGYTAKFPDGQYATCIQCRVANAAVEELVFSLPLQLDTIMSAVCGFKKAVPPIQYTVNPAELIELTPDDFHAVIEDIYADLGLSLRIRAVDWVSLRKVDASDAVYTIQPTDYDYI